MTASSKDGAPMQRFGSLNRSTLSIAVACTLFMAGTVSAQAQDAGTIGDPASWRTDEFNADWGLGAIGAEYAYARGLTGAGITLGQFDSGVALDHQEFAGRDHVAIQLQQSGCTSGTTATHIEFNTGCSVTDGGDPAIDVDHVRPNQGEPYGYYSYGSHGTHVAGTMVANRDGQGMHGVSYGSKLATARFFGDSLYFWDQAADGTWTRTYQGTSGYANLPEMADQLYSRLAAAGGRALNIEIWAPVPEADNTIDYVRGQYDREKAWFDAIADKTLEYDIINVVALGNDNGRIANIYPGLPQFRPDVQSHWLSVANLQRNADGSYTINDSSSICSFTQQWCISAPGTGITSSVIGEDGIVEGQFGGSGTADDPYYYDTNGTQSERGYADFTGTSMAAPHAIGALGLLFERFPYLSSTQVRDVLLTTATDLGAAGVDDIYGWGMIDLRKAIDGPGMLIQDTEVVMDQRAGGAKVWEGEAWDDWRNDISGPGRLTKSGAGWLRLSGDNSFAGATVSAGTLEFTGANAFAGDVSVDGATFLLGGSMSGSNLSLVNGASATISGSMADGNIVATDSAVTLSGSMLNGDVTATGGPVAISGDLTGNLTSSDGPVLVSGSVRQGSIHVSDGTLDLSGSVVGGGLNLVNTVATVNGSVSGATTVSVDSMLQGTGSSGDLIVRGTISPGSSVGTFTVNGNYTQAIGSFYNVELTPPSNSDRLSVAGTATLEGGTVRVLQSQGAYILGQDYRILTATGGITGAFDALDIADFDSPFVRFDLAYGANSVDLNVFRGQALASAAVSPNQIATAIALDSLSDDSTLLQSLVLLNEEEVLPVFDQVSGEAHASTQSLLVDNSRHVRDAAFSRAGHEAVSSQVDDEARFGAWVDVRASSGDIDGNDNVAAVDYDGNLTLVGIDYRFDSGWRVGALGGVGRVDAGFGARGSADVQSRYAGLYTGQRWGGFGLRAGLTHAANDIEVERDIAFENFEDHTRAEYDGTTRQSFVEGGYRFETGDWDIEPYLQYAQVKSEADAFEEQSGGAALAGEAESLDVGLATAGLRFNLSLQGAPQQPARLGLSGGLGYRQANGDTHSGANLAFIDGSDAFQVQGAPIADKATIAELGLALHLGQDGLLQLGYNGQFADESKDHAANIRYSLQF